MARSERRVGAAGRAAHRLHPTGFLSPLALISELSLYRAGTLIKMQRESPEPRKSASEKKNLTKSPPGRRTHVGPALAQVCGRGWGAGRGRVFSESTSFFLQARLEGFTHL